MAWFGKKKAQTPPEEENFISHLTELRDRVIRSLLVILILFGACFYVAPELMKFLAQPLQHALPPGSHAVFIAGEGAFFTLTKMSLLAAVLVSNDDCRVSKEERASFRPRSRLRAESSTSFLMPFSSARSIWWLKSDFTSSM